MSFNSVLSQIRILESAATPEYSIMIFSELSNKRNSGSGHKGRTRDVGQHISRQASNDKQVAPTTVHLVHPSAGVDASSAISIYQHWPQGFDLLALVARHSNQAFIM